MFFITQLPSQLRIQAGKQIAFAMDAMLARKGPSSLEGAYW